MKVVSTLFPAIVHWPNGRIELVGGTIDSIDGVKPTGPVLVGEAFELSEVEWQSPPVKPGRSLAREVKGSKPGVTYTVMTMPNGREVCSCPGYSFRRTCKHVKT